MERKKQISGRRWQDIFNLLDSGWRASEVARRFNINVWRIYRKIKRRRIEAWKKSDKYQSADYKKWRAEVFKRGGHKCLVCGRTSKETTLQADHIKSWSMHPELRFDPKNGRILCTYHHRRTLNFGRRALNYKNERDNDWLREQRREWRERKLKKSLRRKKKTEKGINDAGRFTGARFKRASQGNSRKKETEKSPAGSRSEKITKKKQVT